MNVWKACGSKLLGRRTLLVLVLMVLGINLLPSSVFADSSCDTDTPMIATSDGSLTECQRLLYSSGVYDFDLTTVNPGCSSGGTGTIDANLTGSDNEAKAFTYFSQKGLPPITVAAIVGNLVGESGLNPTRTGGYIAQWGGGRLDNLNKYASQRNQPVTSLALQLDFISIELRLLPVPNGIQAGDYSHVLAATKAQTDIGEATGYFMGTYTFDWYKQNSFNGQNLYSLLDPAAKSFISAHGAVAGYEGPGVPHLDHRISDAKGALQLYGGQAAATASQPTTDPTQATQTTSSADTTTTDTTSGCSTGSGAGNGSDGSGPAVAGQGFIGPVPGGTPADFQCVDYVKWVLSQHFTLYGGQQLSMGNGNQVASNIHARFPQIVLDHTPAVHAVVSFTKPYGSSQSAGHVAMVSGVNTDANHHVTSIIVEEYNYEKEYTGPGTSSGYDKRTITDQAIISHADYAHTEADWK